MVITQSERHPKKEITDFETMVELHVRVVLPYLQ